MPTQWRTVCLPGLRTHRSNQACCQHLSFGHIRCLHKAWRSSHCHRCDWRLASTTAVQSGISTQGAELLMLVMLAVVHCHRCLFFGRTRDRQTDRLLLNGLLSRTTWVSRHQKGCMYVSVGQGSSLLWTHTLRPFYSRPIALTQEGSLVNDVCECVRDWRVRTGE